MVTERNETYFILYLFHTAEKEIKDFKIIFQNLIFSPRRIQPDMSPKLLEFYLIIYKYKLKK